MEDFVFRGYYDAIFLRWCIGYLSDDALKDFLWKAKWALDNLAAPCTRNRKPTAFIFVLDTVAPAGTTLGPFKGQLVRNQGALEQLFNEAGLLIHWKTQE